MVDMETIAASLNALLTEYGVTRDQMADLLGGAADGGPNGDGNYPVTLASGVTVLVPSPRRLASLSGDIGSAIAAIQPILDAANTARQLAQQAETGADLAREKAQDWAEGDGAPGGGDTRSAKRHAEGAAAAELRALAAAASVPVVSGAAPGFFFTLLDEYLNVGLGLREDMALQIRKVLADAVAARTFDLLSGSFAEGAPFGYAWALVGADGGAGGGWKTDGTLVARAAEFSTLNGVDVNAIIAGGGGGGGTARPATSRIYDAEINYLPWYGQSLSMGGQSLPILSGGQRFDSIRFSGGTRTTADNPSPYDAFVPLTELVGGPLMNLGETPLTGSFDMVNELIFAEDRLTKANVAYQLLGSCPGQDGGSLEQQSKGSEAFNRLKGDIANGYRLAQLAGKSFKFRAYGYAQGEGEGGSIGSTTAAMKGGFITLRRDIEIEARSVSGQAERVVALHYQTRFKPHIAQAHYEAARDDPDIYIATPIYMLPLVADGLHLTARGSKLLGAYMGIAYKRVVIDGAIDWKPLVPINCDAQGRVATLRFNVPVGKLTIDTTLVPARGNYGFTLVDANGAAIVITAVTLTGGDTIKLLTANPIPAGARVRYGWDTINPGGNIRDQQGDEIVFDGGGLNYPMHNYLVQFEETLS